MDGEAVEVCAAEASALIPDGRKLEEHTEQLMDMMSEERPVGYWLAVLRKEVDYTAEADEGNEQERGEPDDAQACPRAVPNDTQRAADPDVGARAEPLHEAPPGLPPPMAPPRRPDGAAPQAAPQTAPRSAPQAAQQPVPQAAPVAAPKTAPAILIPHPPPHPPPGKCAAIGCLNRASDDCIIQRCRAHCRDPSCLRHTCEWQRAQDQIPRWQRANRTRGRGASMSYSAWLSTDDSWLSSPCGGGGYSNTAWPSATRRTAHELVAHETQCETDWQ